MKSCGSDTYQNNILYCDNHLLVLDKPAGWLTQPNQSEEESLEAYGKRFLKKRYEKPGAVFLEAVHRLDRPASGIVLFARTSKALSRLQEAQRARKLRKHYLALVEGVPQGEEAVWEDYVVHEAHHARVDPSGKLSRLSWRLLYQGDGYALLSIELYTGRYHQIRVQCAHRGYPLLGDTKYGARGEEKTPFLHHESLAFPHPVSTEEILLHAPLPTPWQKWIPENLCGKLDLFHKSISCPFCSQV